MKKPTVGLIILIMSVLLTMKAPAEEAMVNKNIAGTDYSVSIPADWLYGDKSVTNNSSIIKQLSKTARAFVDDLNNSGMLFMAVDKYMVDLLMLSVTEMEGTDYSNKPWRIIIRRTISDGGSDNQSIS